MNHLTTVNLACQAKMTGLPFMGKGELDCGSLNPIHFDVYSPCPLMSELVSSTSLPPSMIIHD